ncbi:MAG: putative Actinobacterial Holin-X, holin superfamily [Actinomycetota bacterium]
MEQDKNFVGFINSITENITNLVRGHIELAKAEAIEAVKNALKSSVLFLVAIAMVNLGMIFLFIAGAFWLSEAFELSTSTGFLITGGVLFVTALAFVAIAVSKLKNIKNSRKTIDSLNETSKTLLSFRPGKNK